MNTPTNERDASLMSIGAFGWESITSADGAKTNGTAGYGAIQALTDVTVTLAGPDVSETELYLSEKTIIAGPLSSITVTDTGTAIGIKNKG